MDCGTSVIKGIDTPWLVLLRPGILTSKLIELEVETPNGVCEFEGKGFNIPYNLGGQMTLKFAETSFKSVSSLTCGKGFAYLTRQLHLHLGGYPVIAEYNSPPAGTLEGTVTNTSNAAVPNVVMSICSEVTLACYTETTDSSGKYKKAVPAGEYEVTAAPEAGSQDASVIEYGVTVNASQTTIQNFTLPEGGVIKGTVTNQSSAAVPGAVVSICGNECYEAVTNGSGEYSATVPSPETYTIEISPPAGYEWVEAGPLILPAGGTLIENLTLETPTPPPAGTNVAGVSQVEYNGHQFPIVDWESPAPITTQACVGGTVQATVSGEEAGTHNPLTKGPIALTENPASSGTFTGTLPLLKPIDGVGTVAIKVSGCGPPSTVEFTIYIDPSGTVVDGDDANAPLSGATVMLLAGPKLTGPFTAVPNGSAVMSPGNRVNPGLTDASGEFGWDTTPGFYEVEASETGCGTAVVGPFEVPPPQVGLKLVLHCTVRIDTTSLPEATLGQPYSVTLAASGTELPFKWKKLAALPKGLKLSKTGVLSGTMKASKVSPGTYPIRTPADQSREGIGEGHAAAESRLGASGDSGRRPREDIWRIPFRCGVRLDWYQALARIPGRLIRNGIST